MEIRVTVYNLSKNMVVIPAQRRRKPPAQDNSTNQRAFNFQVCEQLQMALGQMLKAEESRVVGDEEELRVRCVGRREEATAVI